MKYHRKLKGMAALTGHDFGAKCMSAIQIDTEKKIAIATDGHLLTVMDIADLIEADEATFLLPREALLAADTMAGRKKNPLCVYMRNAEGCLSVSLAGPKRSQTFGSPTGEFFNWAPVIPKSAGYTMAISLDPELLNRIFKATRSDRSCGVSIYTNSVEGAVMVRSNNSKIRSYSLLMPMRGREIEVPKVFW